jgi:carboxylesterase
MVKAVRKLVAYVRQPTLILHPLEDDYAGMSNANYLRDSLRGPVDLEVLDDCYHLITVDRQRHLVVEAIDRFAANLIGTRTEASAPAASLQKIAAA